MEEIEIDKYLKPEPFSRLGRPGYNRVNMLNTDPSATFMRIKTDYMGNDQLLPAYNIQIGVGIHSRCRCHAVQVRYTRGDA